MIPRWEKGDSPHLPERPEGCFAQMGTVPFPASVLAGRHRRRVRRAAGDRGDRGYGGGKIDLLGAGAFRRGGAKGPPAGATRLAAHRWTTRSASSSARRGSGAAGERRRPGRPSPPRGSRRGPGWKSPWTSPRSKSRHSGSSRWSRDWRPRPRRTPLWRAISARSSITDWDSSPPPASRRPRRLIRPPSAGNNRWPTPWPSVPAD